ncbi:MAG: hypothetical protein K2X53_03690, partial [Alphaproteobacteria bacterium]|nr:hypothetical protein [Alphaproteobacteria bacterium]
QKNAGQEFPGYMIVDKGVHADVLPIPGNEKQMDMVNHQFVSIPVSHAPDGFIPQFFYEGSFKNNGQPRKTWIKEREKIEVINTHVALMYFDEDALRQLYTDAGFVVDDIYYEYAGERVSDTLKPDMTSPGFKLSIIAHKPL